MSPSEVRDGKGRGCSYDVAASCDGDLFRACLLGRFSLPTANVSATKLPGTHTGNQDGTLYENRTSG